ncbi:MAG: hypothetical protein JRJ20_03420 [Deltaproteobacteria bacterium]|nr:hypothetical protein [Deltaproteobacteria bacterium]
MIDKGKNRGTAPLFNNRNVITISLIFFVLGVTAFVFQLAGHHPELAWQAYLINFLLWSAVAQGGVLFSAVMHLVKARWTGPLSGLSESFAGFFPVSFLMFLLLYLGNTHVFPWQYQDLHGKEVWLNLWFLFSRDGAGLLILYGLGFVYLNYSLKLRFAGNSGNTEKATKGMIRRLFIAQWSQSKQDPEQIKKRMTVFSALYIAAFALILSLIGYDLVMSADPHWVSTLFGAYTFVKAFYVGLGALIILAASFYIRHGDSFGLTPARFHDLGKLYFAFCLLWADFFYVQFLVIWYGNIPEETSYIIIRTMTSPWNNLAWTVFILCFIIPFFVLLNKKIKTKPWFMIVLCSLAIVGMWLEHLLLLGPALNQHVTAIPLGLTDGLIFIGFLGSMMLSVTFFLNLFPELIVPARTQLAQSKEVK